MTSEPSGELVERSALEDAVRDFVTALAPHTQGCDLCKKMVKRWAGLIRSVKNAQADPVAWLTIEALDPVREERDALLDKVDREEHWRSHYEAAQLGWNQALDQLDAAREREARAIAILTATYKIRNMVGDDICDLCGGEIQWPNHKPECEIGKVLAALSAGAGEK